MPQQSERSSSSSLVFRVNAAKLLALAALVPPATIGIARRASELSGPGDDAETIAFASTAGSVAAVIGALALGALADIGAATPRMRWLVVLGGTCAGFAGLAFMAGAESPGSLIAGWGVAQLGFSGAMAVLRALIGDALPGQRRRGATVMVLFSYLGAFLPILILLAFPGTLWMTTLALAALAVVIPLTALGVPRLPPMADASPASRHADGDDPRGAHDVTLPWPLVLFAQLGMNVLLSAYLAYHSAEIASRTGEAWGDSTVQLSSLTLLAGILGLLTVASILLVRPRLLGNAHAILISAGLVFSVGVGLRPFAEAVPALLAVVLLSGAAVGAISTTLFATALEGAPRTRLGRRLGLYSALGPLGQIAGRLLALAILRASSDETAYRHLFPALALVPILLVVGTLASLLRSRRGSARFTGAIR
ncbi:MFS transporter [Microbacterium karelineae]|uniref:MFS transporter n=1 Tax=Microbacterium karelineae TaxID=2654283 RepID=UPI0012E9F8E3|nr:MFS transporter [Microbacterium karelineae]